MSARLNPPHGTLLALFALGCGNGFPSPSGGGDPSGVFAYQAQSGGIAVVEGTMTLALHGDSTLSGSWDLHRVPGTDPSIVVGPQLGSGTLAGSVSSGAVLLNLNPGWADNNVFLVIRSQSTALLSGTWDHSTLIGSVAGGRVELRRVTR